MIPRRLRLPFMLAAALLAGCTNQAGTAPAAAPLASGARARLPAVRDERSGLRLQSCGDLLAALRAGQDLGEIPERQEFADYEGCIRDALARHGRGYRSGRFDLARGGDQIYRDLDLATVHSSLAPRRPAEHYRLSDFHFDTVRAGGLWLELADSAFAYRVDILTIGDFRHRGQAELLVRFTDRATRGGTYDRTTLLVLDIAPDSGTITATDALEVLAAALR